jgi:hypothetical protein
VAFPALHLVQNAVQRQEDDKGGGEAGKGPQTLHDRQHGSLEARTSMVSKSKLDSNSLMLELHVQVRGEKVVPSGNPKPRISESIMS